MYCETIQTFNYKTTELFFYFIFAAMNPFSTIVLPITLFLIMIGIGMSARVKDFSSLIKFPKAAIVGIISQSILLPLLAYCIALLLGVDQIILFGFLLIALCPSGSGSNIISKMVGGNIALSISLTVISSIVSLFLLPNILNWYMQFLSTDYSVIEIPIASSLGKIFLTSVFPVSLGLLISEKAKTFAIKAKQTLKWLLPGLLFTVFCLIFLFESGENNIDEMVYFFKIAFLLNVTSMLFAFFLARFTQVKPKQALSIAIEGGLKNSAVGLFIAISILQSEIVSNLLIAYGMVSFYTTVLLAFGLKKLVIKEEITIS